jgi:hypothetical protein
MGSVVLVTPEGAALQLAQRQIQPPTSVYLSNTDVLAITSQSSAPVPDVEIRARILRKTGNIDALRFVHTPNSDRSVKSEAFSQGEGYLLGLTCVPVAPGITRGMTFVSVHIAIGQGQPSVVLHGLVQDYVESGYNLGWPGGPIRSSTEGPGLLRFVSGTAPPPNGNIAESPPTNARWRIISGGVTLTTDATAGTRTMSVAVQHGAFGFFNSDSVVTAGPGSFIGATFADFGFSGPGVNQSVSIALPFHLILTSAEVFAILGHFVGPGDTFNQPEFFVEEWITQ